MYHATFPSYLQRNQLITLWEFPCTLFFSLIDFSTFSLPLICQFITVSAYSSLNLSFLGLCASWTWVTVSFPMLEKFLAIVSSKISSGPFSLSLFFWDPYNANVSAFTIVQRSLRLLFLFILYCSAAVIYTILTSRPHTPTPHAGEPPILAGKSGLVSYKDSDSLSWVLVHTRLCECPPWMEFVSPSPVKFLWLNYTGLQSQILWGLPLLPDAHAGEPDVGLRTITPVGELLWYN